MCADVGDGWNPGNGWMFGIRWDHEKENFSKDFWREFEYCCQGVPLDLQIYDRDSEAVDLVVDFLKGVFMCGQRSR